MKKHLFTILIGATSMVVSGPARAQSVVATHDAYGHTVWVSGDDAQAQPKAQTPQPAMASTTQPVSSAANAVTVPAPQISRYSGLVYWSNKQKRWVPVPLASSATMQAAQRAAKEVNDTV